MTEKMDGRYYRVGRSVKKRPKRNGNHFIMGRTICTLEDGVGTRVAMRIAKALNDLEAKERWDVIITKNREEHEA